MFVRRITHTARSVRARWQRQYQHYKHDPKPEITAALAALPDDATLAQVDAAIGNSSWTTERCTRCNEWVTECLQIGDEPDYESYTVNVCLPCARLTVLDIEQALQGAK